MKVKVVVGLMIVVAVTGVSLAAWRVFEPLSVEVSPTSRMIVPPVDPDGASNWATNTAYSYGAFVRNTTYPVRMYWVVSAGTSSTNAALMPDALDGDDTDDSSVTYRVVRRHRDHLTITAPTNSAIWLAFGWTNATAVVTNGIRIAAGERWESPNGDCPQCGIHAVTELAVTNRVGVQEN